MGNVSSGSWSARRIRCDAESTRRAATLSAPSVPRSADLKTPKDRSDLCPRVRCAVLLPWQIQAHAKSGLLAREPTGRQRSGFQACSHHFKEAGAFWLHQGEAPTLSFHFNHSRFACAVCQSPRLPTDCLQHTFTYGKPCTALNASRFNCILEGRPRTPSIGLRNRRGYLRRLHFSRPPLLWVHGV